MKNSNIEISKSFDRKMSRDKFKLNRIFNSDLICKDCKFRYDDSKQFGNTSRCKMFNLKPASVFSKYFSECKFYKKK